MSSFICEYCNKIHDGSFGSGRFCSRSCANSRGPRSEETKEKQRQWAKNNPRGVGLDPAKYGRTTKGRRRVDYIISICKCCGEEFEHRKSEPKMFCSKECNWKMSGGKRHGAGRGKKGWYKNFYCDSTWELAFIIYCLDHNILIERNETYWMYLHPENKKQYRYYPDFRVDGKLTEIKGYKTIVDMAKIQCVNEPIDLFYAKNLKHIFKYVVETYKVPSEDFDFLYTGKEKYAHICEECKEDFQSTKEDSIYCSRRCSMLGNRKK